MKPCEALFERLADTDPEALIALMPGLEPHHLTFAAEQLGRSKHYRAAEILIPLLQHQSIHVREGAIYGLEQLEMTNTIRFALTQRTDPSNEANETLRGAARDALSE